MLTAHKTNREEAQTPPDAVRSPGSLVLSVVPKELGRATLAASVAAAAEQMLSAVFTFWLYSKKAKILFGFVGKQVLT